jgi:hypothetical protein
MGLYIHTGRGAWHTEGHTMDTTKEQRAMKAAADRLDSALAARSKAEARQAREGNTAATAALLDSTGGRLAKAEAAYRTAQRALVGA